MKNMLASMVSMALLSSVSATNGLAYAIDYSNPVENNDGLIAETSISYEQDKKIDVAKEFLYGYYYAKDQYISYDFTPFSDNKYFLSYIDGKITAANYELIAYPKDDKRNYDLNLTCVDVSDNVDSSVLKINAVVTFNYKGSDVQSGYGEQSWIKIQDSDNDGYEVVDWYIPYDEYDISIRGDIASLPNSDIWTKDSEKLLQRQNAENKSLKEYYSTLNTMVYSNDMTDTMSNKGISSINALYSLNKSSISTWAENNCSLTNPSSGNSSQVSSYYDFSTIPGNYDCTNFVSHAILAGGAPVYDTGGSGISGTGWYFRNINNRSSSWSGVTNLYSFIVNNSTKGPVATELSYTNIYAPSGNFPYTYGDLIQFHNGSTWIHSGVVTSFLYLSGSSTTLEAGVTSRTNSSTYTLNKRQSQIYSGHSRRILRLDGYYA